MRGLNMRLFLLIMQCLLNENAIDEYKRIFVERGDNNKREIFQELFISCICYSSVFYTWKKYYSSYGKMKW